MGSREDGGVTQIEVEKMSAGLSQGRWNMPDFCRCREQDLKQRIQITRKKIPAKLQGEPPNGDSCGTAEQTAVGHPLFKIFQQSLDVHLTVAFRHSQRGNPTPILSSELPAI